MLDVISLKKTFSQGDLAKLLDFFQCHKKRIYVYLREFIRSEPLTPYQQYILNHVQGEERSRIYFDCFEAALSGDLETFLEDQKQIGYIRAMEGYRLNDVYGYTMAFKDAIRRASLEYNATRKEPAARLDNDDMYIFNKLLDGAYYLLSLSFLETRDELIRRQRERLQALQRFAARVVSIFDEEYIWAQTTQGVFDVFGLSGTFILPEGECFSENEPGASRMIGLQIARRDLEKILSGVYRFKEPIGMEADDSLHLLSDVLGSNRFRLIASPIKDRKSQLTGVLCVHDQGRDFVFSKFDCNLLFQFSYFTGAVSSNCRMVSEIAEKQEDLKSLTTRLISVQEEERKKIAADIHDVLTQALTGIGYKALYCMEIMEKDPDRLYRELELLTDTINDALRQSRQIISNLRPHILDDIGIIAAFRKLLGEFGEKFAIKVRFSHPEALPIDTDKGIALFRILQEALHNARRHAEASQIDLTLSLDDRNCLIMEVADNGRGFDSSQRRRRRQQPGLGLLTMRERAEDLGGEFRVEAEPDNGCIITVKIPLT